MRASFEKFGGVLFRALAQLIFSDKPLAGVLVLFAIALISPWCAVGAVVGAVCGNAAHLLLKTYAQSAWRAGAAGFNCAVIGILWGGFPAAGEPNISLLAAALLGCILLEAVAARVLGRARLPVLVLPATLTALSLSLALAGPSSWLWIDTNAVFGELGVALAIVLVIVALALDSPRHALPVVVISGAAALLAKASMSTGVLASASLWAFTVAPAVLAMQMLCFGPTVRSALAGAVAAAVGSTLWMLWSTSGAMGWAPPLLLPYVLGVWVAIALGRISATTMWLNGALWKTLYLLWPRPAGQRTVAVLAGDISALNRQPGTLPIQALPPSHDHAMANVSAWETCDRTRRALAELQPTRGHFLLAELERRGMVCHIVTSTQDTCFERAGSINVSHLHGIADRTVCSGCKRTDHWPPGRLWRVYTLRCAACGALLNPVLLHGEMGVEAVRAKKQIEKADVVLVIEPDGRSGEFLGLIQTVRAHGSRVVVIKDRRTSFCPAPGDMIITGAVETVLSTMSRVLLISRSFRQKRGQDLPKVIGSVPS